jgi:hypothetical protein
MIVSVSPEVEDQLAQLAHKNGKPIAEVAGALLEEKLRESLALKDEEEDTDPDALARAIARMTNRTPEEIAAAQQRAIVAYPAKNPLPPGQTILDVIDGKWPGNETDEEVFEALRKLS